MDKELLSGRDWVKHPLFDWPDWTTPWQGWLFGRDGVEQSLRLGIEFRQKLRLIDLWRDPEKCGKLIPSRFGEEDRGLQGSNDFEKLLTYLAELFKEKARRIHFLYPFPAVPEPPAGYLERWSRIQKDSKQDVILPSLCRPWHPATYRTTGRRDRFSDFLNAPIVMTTEGRWQRCPSIPNLDYEALDSEQYHSCGTEISIGPLSSATKKNVVQCLFDEKLEKLWDEDKEPFTDEPLERMQLFKEMLADEIQASADVVARIKNDYEEAKPLEPPEEFRLRPTIEELREWDKILGIPREPSGCRFKFIYNGEDGEEGDDDFMPSFEPVSGVERSEDDEEQAPKEHDYVFFNSPETTKNHVDRSDVDAAMAMNAAGGDYHNLGEPITREENGVKVNAENAEFKSDSYIREWMFTNPSKDPDDDGQWIKETAAKLKMEIGTFRRRISRFRAEVEVMKEQGMIPKDAPRLTYEQAVEIADCGAAYILVQLPRSKWRWYKLDLENGRTVDEAIENLKTEKLAARLEFDLARDREAYNDYDKAFLPINRRVVGPVKPRWAGILSELAEE